MPYALPNLPDLQAGNIYCIGRNYADHARELNNPIPSEPVIFSKPTTALTGHHSHIAIPRNVTEVHHEAELVIAIGSTARNVSAGNGLSHIAGIAAGIDVTDRAMQSQLKKDGLPWLLAKGLDTFAPIGPFYTNMINLDFNNIDVMLSVNGALKQHGNTKLMLFPVADLVARVSKYFTLQPGDLIFTGTPAGVGPMQHGDQVIATIKSGMNILSEVSVTVKKSD